MASVPTPKHVLDDWRPEDPAFWASTGKKIATRNLWISVPNLLLAFSVWMVWSMVVAKLKLIGFTFTTDQLFWLAALPALSGATLRIFYSFIVPVFGGRMWTVLSMPWCPCPPVRRFWPLPSESGRVRKGEQRFIALESLLVLFIG
eukprot:gene36486-biopygen23981